MSCAGGTLQTNELYQAETALVQTITPFPSIAVAAGVTRSARGGVSP